MLVRARNLLALMAICLLVAGCSAAPRTASRPASDDTSEVVYGASMGQPSIGGSALFYISDAEALLSYYDLDSGSSDVICADAGCDHASDSCIAYVGDVSGGPVVAGGFARYQNKLYLLRRKIGSMGLELLAIDPEQQTKEVVATLGGSGDDSSAWTVDKIGDAYYAGGRAWAKLRYARPTGDATTYESASQLVSVDLSSGKVDDLTGILPESEGLWGLDFTVVNPEFALYKHTFFDVPSLSQAEYVAQGGAAEAYAAYLGDYYATAPRSGELVRVDAAGGATSTFWEGPLTSTYVDSWGETYFHLPYEYCGTYGGKLLRSEFSVQDGVECTDVALVDDAGNAEELLQIKDGGLTALLFGGSAANLVYGDGTFLYSQDGADGSADYYRYSIGAKKSTQLFTADPGSVLQIIGETGDRLVGRADGELVWMSRSDFDAGRTDAAHRIDIDA